jgi:hypothetical protein
MRSDPPPPLVKSRIHGGGGGGGPRLNEDVDLNRGIVDGGRLIKRRREF